MALETFPDTTLPAYQCDLESLPPVLRPQDRPQLLQVLPLTLAPQPSLHLANPSLYGYIWILNLSAGVRFSLARRDLSGRGPQPPASCLIISVCDAHSFQMILLLFLLLLL